MSTDWMPGKREEQLALAEKWIAQLPISQGAWTMSAAEIADFEATVMAARAALSRLAVQGPTPLNTANAREAFSAMKAAMRFLRRRKFFSPPMTEGDWARIGLKPPDLIRTPQPVPSSIPEIETNSSVIRQLSFRLRDHGASGWAKPAHVHAMEFAWSLRETRPDHVDEFPELEVATANPITLDFEEADRGHRVYYSARWVNSTMQGGPWSDIESAFIP